MRRRILWALLLGVCLTVIGAGIGVWWLRGQMRASLPQIDGTLRLAGLAGPVMVERDALGIPTIRGGSRQDVARATGFVHAQDRFFQMDLMRRRAAGELAALVGPRAVEADGEIRIHRFRAEAERALALLPPADRALVESYAAGVNAGLTSLGNKPFEYLLLRQEPAIWRPEDSLLVVLSMFITLQDPDAGYESMLGTMHDVLPPEVAAFASAPGTDWDTPVVGAPIEVPPVPGPEIYNLRQRRTGKVPLELVRARREEEASLGSNNWAVNGSLTGNGGALVANDVHLSVRVPQHLVPRQTRVA